MVKFQRGISKKRYLNSKRVYEYERLSLDIPKKYHKLIDGSQDRDFDLSVSVEKETMILKLTPKEVNQA